MRRLALFILPGLFLAGCHSDSAVAIANSKPAVARRSVKTATDLDAAKIDRTPVATTVEEIAGIKAPKGELAGRTPGFETTTYRVEATVKSVELKKDGDYYLVLQGDKGGQTVVEVPDPKTCENSPLHDDIAAARKELEERYHPTKEVKEVNERATVTGVGFLGWGNKGKGATGKSGPRLMPGTGIDFG
jgi:hypothetical protein